MKKTNARWKPIQRRIGHSPTGASPPLSDMLKGKDNRKQDQLRQSLTAKSNAELESLTADPSTGDLGPMARELLRERAAQERITKELAALDSSALVLLTQEPDQDFKHCKAREILQERQLQQLPTLTIPDLERVVNESSDAVFQQARKLLLAKCRERVAGLDRTELTKMALSSEADSLHMEARRLWIEDENEALAALRLYKLNDLDELLAAHHDPRLKSLIRRIIAETEDAPPTCAIDTLRLQPLNVLKATLKSERNKANRALLQEVIRQMESEAAKAAIKKQRRKEQVLRQREDKARSKQMALMAVKRVTGGIDTFLGRFPRGFADPMYLTLERSYKWKAHESWKELLNAHEFTMLLKRHKYHEITKRAMRIEAKSRFMLHSTQKMALHDAVKGRTAAKLFTEGLYDLIYGLDRYEIRFERFATMLGKLPQVNSPVLTWPIQTIFPFLALPKEHIFLKPKVTKAAAKWRGVSLNYKSSPNWLTYSCLLRLAASLKADLADLKPRDMIDIQSFIWVTEFDDYVDTY